MLPEVSLEKFAVGIVPSRLHPIFRDRDELPSSSSLSHEIQVSAPTVAKSSDCLFPSCSRF